jgi:trigger factor
MYDFDVPQNMVDMENADILKQITEEGKRLNKEITPKIKEECRKISESRVRSSFVIAAIAKRDKIRVTKDEISRAIKHIATMYPGNERAILEMYRRPDMLNTLVGPILEKKVLDTIAKTIKIKEKKCSIKDLIARDEETFDFFKDNTEKVGKLTKSTSKENISKSKKKKVE